MAKETPQTLKNHTRMVPLYHYLAMPILLINSLASLYSAATELSIHAALDALVAIALLLLVFFARIFALGAQDRVIRLEERLRMQQLLADNLKPRIAEFTTDQLVALRFASDAELPDLAQRVLDENISERKVIKKLIATWRADYQRV